MEEVIGSNPIRSTKLLSAIPKLRRVTQNLDTQVLYNQSVPSATDSLISSLTYSPVELRFGTSGRRGELIHLTQLEVYINAIAEVRYLLSLRPGQGGIVAGEDFYFAYDLRPSSTGLTEGAPPRGELCQAVQQAITDAGMKAVNLGAIPTPALTCYALARNKGSIMVTGSHIPFDRNGYKLNTSKGELLKEHEGPIGEAVARVRTEVYGQPAASSMFDNNGMFRSGHRELPNAHAEGLEFYRDRYLRFFPENSLAGKRILVYQHSAVGRDFLTELLAALGAEVIPAGRSNTFVPIDTENIDDEQLGMVQALADAAAARHGDLDAVASTDGDSDRPLLLGIGPGNRLRFFGGDLLGMVVAEYLRADAVVVPISCNDAIDRGSLRPALRPKTRIGSPYVIEGMEKASAAGATLVCGWEANGGFLLGSEVRRGSRKLAPLPTRDAMLPILCVLSAAAEQKSSLAALFNQLPHRYSRAALLKNFPRETSLAILRLFGPDRPDAKVCAGQFFSQDLGFSGVNHLDYTDGVRIGFSNGEVAHLRPSGNADEFRIYAVADSQERADQITALGVREPDGILRTLERSV